MPVVSTVGNRGKGMEELLKEIVAVSEHKEPLTRHIHINYGTEVEEEIKINLGAAVVAVMLQGYLDSQKYHDGPGHDEPING